MHQVGFFLLNINRTKWELGSKNSLASTYDNDLEAIFKRILIFISETFDKINRIQGSVARVV